MKTVRSFTAAVVPLIALGAALFVGSSTAVAQSEESGSAKGLEGTWHEGLEGTWREQLTVLNCDDPSTTVKTFPTIFAFAKGGTLTATTSGQLPSVSTTGLGVWNHLYGRTYSAVSEFFIFSPIGAPTQIHRLTRLIKVSRDAKRYTADTIALEILDINYNQIGTGCAAAVASRME
jgi:hypothetical protein